MKYIFFSLLLLFSFPLLAQDGANEYLWRLLCVGQENNLFFKGHAIELEVRDTGFIHLKIAGQDYQTSGPMIFDEVLFSHYQGSVKEDGIFFSVVRKTGAQGPVMQYEGELSIDAKVEFAGEYRLSCDYHPYICKYNPH